MKNNIGYNEGGVAIEKIFMNTPSWRDDYITSERHVTRDVAMISNTSIDSVHEFPIAFCFKSSKMLLYFIEWLLCREDD